MLQIPCQTGARLNVRAGGILIYPWPYRLLVLLNEDELSRLQTCPALFGGVSRPLGRILAGGLAVVVVTGEVEVAVHPYRNKALVGLERNAVGMHRIELVGDRAVGTGGNEVADGLDRTELVEEGGFLDGLHNRIT